MVPLVSLFSDASMPEEVENWKTSIKIALEFFGRVSDWSIAAKRSGDVVSRIYTAYKTHAAMLSQHTVIPTRQPSRHDFSLRNTYPQMNVPHLSLDASATPYGYNATMPGWPSVDSNDPNFLNYFWDDMMWDTNLPDIPDAPHGPSNDYDFAGAAQDSGIGGAYWMHGN
jgi:hypothetical protein